MMPLGHVRTRQFRSILTSWGISVDLTAQAVTKGSMPTDDLRRISSSVWLRIEAMLHEDAVHYIERGLQRMAEAIAATCGDELVITVLDSTHNWIDYMDEALEPAMALWASDYFGLEPPALVVTYDADENTYRFWMD